MVKKILSTSVKPDELDEILSFAQKTSQEVVDTKKLSVPYVPPKPKSVSQRVMDALNQILPGLAQIAKDTISSIFSLLLFPKISTYTFFSYFCWNSLRKFSINISIDMGTSVIVLILFIFVI